MVFMGKTGEHDASFDRQAHRAVIGHNNGDIYSPIKSNATIHTARSSSRKSEIHDGFMKSFQPSQVKSNSEGEDVVT